MGVGNIKFDNYFDLLLLHRVFLEAKFTENPHDRDVTVSPQVAKISNQIVDEIIELLEKSENKKRSEWLESVEKFFKRSCARERSYKQ